MSEQVDSELESLLQPLPGDDPCGVPVVFDPAFTAIRLEREEDDPSLSMRHWERPLKVADWPAIERRCCELLTQKGKDLQVAAWLLEAWLRQHQLAGLDRGLRLMAELLRRYPDTVYPRVDETGDVDARLAPFEWLSEWIPRLIKVHVPLVVVPELNPSQITLAVWEKLTMQELAAKPSPHHVPAPEAPELKRSMVMASVKDTGGDDVLKNQSANDDCLRSLGELQTALDQCMGEEAPSMRRIREVLVQLARILGQLAPAPAKPVAAAAPDAEQMKIEKPDQDMKPEGQSAVEKPQASVSTSGWKSREEAYQTLEALADYLNQTEPHSPTPYLIRRAVNWGRMSLPELMEEIVREEGDLNRLTTVLGLNRQSVE